MPVFRSLAAVVGLVLPVLAAGAADARPHHKPAQLQTATYKVPQHKAAQHRHAMLTHRRMAQLHRHSIMRGS